MKKRTVEPEESELLLSKIADEKSKDDKALDKKSKTKKTVLCTAVGVAVAMAAGVAAIEMFMPNEANTDTVVNKIDTGIYEVTGIKIDLNGDGITGAKNTDEIDEKSGINVKASLYGVNGYGGSNKR